MPITRKQAEHYAHLAQLTLTGSEFSAAEEQLEQLLRCAAHLKEVDDGTAPLTHILPLETVLRDDIPAASLPREVLLNCAPARDGSCYLVPKAVE